MAVTQAEVLNLFSQIGAIANSDNFLLFKANANGTMTAAKVTAQVLRAYLAGAYSVTIGEDGYFYIGGVKTNVEATGDGGDGAFDISEHNAVNGIARTYVSLDDALAGNNVPDNKRKGGMRVKYIDQETGKYAEYRLTSNIWSNNSENWQSGLYIGEDDGLAEIPDFDAASQSVHTIPQVLSYIQKQQARANIGAASNEELDTILREYRPIVINGDVTNAPDEEDLTSVNVGGTDIIRFKDKSYAPSLYSGLGRKLLRKNVKTIEGVTANFLEQSMMTQANTIYVIQYDFSLGVNEHKTLTFTSANVSSVMTQEKKDYDSAVSAYNSALDDYNAAVALYNTANDDYIAAVTVYEEAVAAYEADPTQANKEAMETALEDMEAKEKAKNDAEDNMSDAADAKASAEESKNKAQARYNAIGNQDYYYWAAVNIDANHAIHLSGRAFLLNSDKSGKVAVSNGIVLNDGNITQTVYIGCLPGSYDYLYDSCIVVPDNSILLFEGGSISNGTLYSDGHFEIASGVKCLDNVRFGGVYTRRFIADLRWFVAEYPVNTSDTSIDNTDEVRQCLTCGTRSVLFPADKFIRLTETVVMNETVNILTDVVNRQLVTFSSDRERGMEVPCIFSELVVTLFEFHIGAYNDYDDKYNNAYYIGGITLVTTKPFSTISLDPENPAYRGTPVLYIDNRFARNTSWGIKLDCNVGAVTCKVPIDLDSSETTSSACNWTGIDVRTAVNPYTGTDHAIAFLEINGDLFNLGMGFTTVKSGSSYFNDVIFRGHSECAFGCDNGAGGVLMIYGSNQVKFMPESMLTQKGYFRSKTLYLFGWVWDADSNRQKGSNWVRANCKVETTIETETNNFWTDMPINASNDYRVPNPVLTGKRLTGNVDLSDYPNILYNGLANDELGIVTDLQYDIMLDTEQEYVPSLNTSRIINGHCLFNDIMRLPYRKGSGLPAIDKTSMDIAYANGNIRKVRTSFKLGNYFYKNIPTFLLLGCWNYGSVIQPTIAIDISKEVYDYDLNVWKWVNIYDENNPLNINSYRYTDLGFVWKIDLNRLGCDGRKTAITIEFDYSAMQNKTSNNILPYIFIPWYYSGVPKLRHCSNNQMPFLNTNNKGWNTFNDNVGKPGWWNGTRWMDASRYPLLAKTRGTTAQRPVGGQNGTLSSLDVGFRYYDTDLNAPIYAESINEKTGEVVWTDSNGSPLNYTGREIVELLSGKSVSGVLRVNSNVTDEEFMRDTVVSDINDCISGGMTGWSAVTFDVSAGDMVSITGVGSAYRRMWYVISKATGRVTAMQPQMAENPSDAYRDNINISEDSWIVSNLANEDYYKNEEPLPYANKEGTPYKIVKYSAVPVPQIPTYGTLSDRPTTSLDETKIGFQYFATDLGDNGKPIFWNGTAWVDALGNDPDTQQIE